MKDYIAGIIIEIVKPKDFYGPAVYAVRLRSNRMINIMIPSAIPEEVGNSIQITDKYVILEKKWRNPDGKLVLEKPTFQELLKTENKELSPENIFQAAKISPVNKHINYEKIR